MKVQTKNVYLLPAVKIFKKIKMNLNKNLFKRSNIFESFDGTVYGSLRGRFDHLFQNLQKCFKQILSLKNIDNKKLFHRIFKSYSSLATAKEEIFLWYIILEIFEYNAPKSLSKPKHGFILQIVFMKYLVEIVAGEKWQNFNPQQHLLERHPKNFWNRISPEVFLVSELSVKVEAETGSDSAGSTLSLQSVGPRDPDGVERLHALRRIESLFLHSADVNDEDAIVDGDRRLGDVGRQDDLPNAVARLFEHGRLLL